MTTSAPASRSATAHREGQGDQLGDVSRSRGRTAPLCRRRGTSSGRMRHRARRSVTCARGGAEDRTVNVRMSQPNCERKLSTRRDTEHSRALGGQRNAESRPRPAPDVLDEELLMGREPLRVEVRRVLMEPPRLIGHAVHTDDHRGRDVGRLEDFAPPGSQLTVTGEHHRLGRGRRHVDRDLPTTVVLERLGDEPSRAWLVIHGRTPSPRTAAPWSCAHEHARSGVCRQPEGGAGSGHSRECGDRV